MGFLQALALVLALIATALPVQSGPVALAEPAYYSPPPAYYSPPPPPPYYSPPEYYSPPPPPPYYSPPEYYSPPPPPPYYSPPEYYSPPPPPPYYSPPEYYSPPPPPPYYSPPEYYSPPPPAYYAPPPPAYYAPPPPYYTKPEYYSKEYYPEYVNYEAVHCQDLNVSLVCGILPAVNADLYKGSYNPQDYEKSYSQYGSAIALQDDVLPYGASPWSVLITDDYNNLICQGVIVHNHQILTLASCVYNLPLDSLRVRYGDWDVLNDVNEYEAYKNYQTRICRVLPVSCPSAYGYGYNSDSYAELVLLQLEAPEDYDKYPQIKPVCLPEWPYSAPPTYTPSYAPPPYSAPPSYGYAPAPYSAPPSYSSPPPYYQPEYTYSECWVAGYYASPSKDLQNHEPPKASAYSSYKQQDYNPYYSQDSYPEKSKIPRKAQVKRVKSYDYQQPAYGYQECKEEVQEWVGVNGYDACVADKGSPIVCIVDEHVGYAYDSYQQSYDSYQQQPPYYAPYENYQEIKVNPAQPKQVRKRAVVVAVVKEITTCTEYEAQGDYSGYDKTFSKSIKAIKVDDNDVKFIVDKFFEGALDYSCPAPKSYYPEPSYYPETKQAYAPPPYYTPVYTPPPYYEPSYSPPPYSPPTYSAPPPPYYEPSYSPPPYSPPQYYEPSYSPPPYSPPQYSPPSYSPPPPYYSAPPTYSPAPYSPSVY